MKELTLLPRDGDPISVSSFSGRVGVVVFVSKAACHTGQSLELADQLLLEIGPTQFMAAGCIVDLERDERLREYAPFIIPIGAAPRRQVSEFLNVPMSGFALPQFLILDRSGKQRFLLCIPRGDDFWEMTTSVRQLVDLLLAEPISTDSAVRQVA